MKQRSIKIGILAVIFLLALFVSSYFINTGSGEMTADMGVATLPTISFQTAGEEANLSVGHVRDMNLVTLRDTIAVYDKTNQIEINLYHAEHGIEELRYEIYSIDGETKLFEGKVDEVKNTVVLDLGTALKTNQEGILKIILTYMGEPLYYYTRVIKDHNYHVEECIEYVKELHNNFLKKENEDAVKKVIESNSEGNNSTLQHVTIHSNYEHVTWGNLNPNVLDELRIEIKEIKSAYTSVLLRYQVKCAGDNNEEEVYQVKEFFKVYYGKERIYLYEYDRTMQEVFDTSNVVLSGKGIVLGITEKVPYKVNEDGTIVAFIQGNALWNYQREEDSFALVFSFAESENKDERNQTDLHEIQILSMENSGNMTFSVSGYMNRGIHEGESGVAVYYYNLEQNCVEEVAFIPSNTSYQAMKKEVNELAYYNKKQEVLYVMSKGTLLKVDMKKNQEETLVESLEKGQYVTSTDGHLLAYQKAIDGKTVTEIWNFAEDKREEIQAQAGEIIIPLGFVGADFVYGISKTTDIGKDAMGNHVQAMYALKIRNIKGEVVKTYQEPDVYILDAIVDDNMVTLKQGIKNGSTFKEISEDYITNNETTSSAHVSLKTYITELKETQYRLEFASGITEKSAKVLKPKQVLQERVRVLDFATGNAERYFYVYGHGKQAGIFEEAGPAIELADTLSGVVLSSKQDYIWEEHNRVAWYRNFEINQFTVKDGESTLDACIRKAISHEGASAEDKQTYLRNCSVKDMFYLMNQGKAVIALKNGAEAVLLVGYDAKTVTYIDPANGGIYTYSIERMNEILKGSGNTFIVYM